MVFGLMAIGIVSPAAIATPPGLKASVTGPPEVQRVGNSYIVFINIRNSGGWVPKFCIDFGDDNNSWKIVMPGLKSYNNDVFCYGTLRDHKKQFVARIIPAKTGEKTLEICMGRAQSIYTATNDAILEDNQLCWSASFVLT
jgi:hypothetical protein